MIELLMNGRSNSTIRTTINTVLISRFRLHDDFYMSKITFDDKGCLDHLSERLKESQLKILKIAIGAVVQDF